jgi:hypothetical protein
MAPTKTVSIRCDQYGLILSGRYANKERRLSALRPVFHNAFCKRKNLSAWAKVGTMLEIDQQNKLACDHLNELGFNGDSFLIKARR